MVKQKLHIELKNAPADTSQVRCSASTSLNSPECRDSVTSKVLVCNNLKVNQAQQTGRRLTPFVFVLNNNGKPLIPCSFAKSKRIVKQGLAKLVNLNPFTIRLISDCDNKTQPVTLGIDSGYKEIGFSAVTEKNELVSGVVLLDNKTTKRLSDKRMYRRLRRNRLWYREPRWQNRANQRTEGRLAPSVQRRLDTHFRIVEKFKKLLPITKVIVETASFDIQKIRNPEISGEQYQQGNMLGYYNTKAYLLAREQGKCQLCKKSVLGTRTELHHIIRRSEGGTDKPDNLALLHTECHERLHKENLKLKSNKRYKAETAMSVMRKRLGDLGDVTFGYITQTRRIDLGLEKSHHNDAFCIAGGFEQQRVQPIVVQNKHRNNRSLRILRGKYGYTVRTQHHNIQPLDMCWFNKKLYYSRGSQNKGTHVKLHKVVSVNKLDKFYNTNSLVFKNE